MDKRPGFTLLELAIFLLVLTLMLGGLLKWRTSQAANADVVTSMARCS